MDSFQQPHGYMRPPQPPPPPPPHTPDPHHHPFHNMPPPPPPPPHPPQGPWFNTQFQYQNPSPPPQWPPPPPPSNPYSYHPSQFPPPPPPPHPRSQAPPPPHPHPQFQPHSHIPQPYPQEWSNNSGWSHHQGYQAPKNEEDWGAKARAWADAKAAMDSQHPQSHFSPAGRLQEQTHYHDPYQQSVDSRYNDVQNQPHPSSGYQQQFSFVDASMQQHS